MGEIAEKRKQTRTVQKKIKNDKTLWKNAVHNHHFDIKTGLFGTDPVVGRHGKKNIRSITTDRPEKVAFRMFKNLKGGAELDALYDNKGAVAEWENGTKMAYRPKSKSGSPAIDIKSKEAGVKTQKIHLSNAERASTYAAERRRNKKYENRRRGKKDPE